MHFEGNGEVRVSVEATPDRYRLEVGDLTAARIRKSFFDDSVPIRPSDRSIVNEMRGDASWRRMR